MESFKIGINEATTKAAFNYPNIKAALCLKSSADLTLSTIYLNFVTSLGLQLYLLPT